MKKELKAATDALHEMVRLNKELLQYAKAGGFTDAPFESGCQRECDKAIVAQLDLSLLLGTDGEGKGECQECNGRGFFEKSSILGPMGKIKCEFCQGTGRARPSEVGELTEAEIKRWIVSERLTGNITVADIEAGEELPWPEIRKLALMALSSLRKPQDTGEAEIELCGMIKDALKSMARGQLHSGPLMDLSDFKAISGTALERFESLTWRSTPKENL